MPILTSFLCEQWFSALTHLKNKKTEQLIPMDEEISAWLSTICSKIKNQIYNIIK